MSYPDDQMVVKFLANRQGVVSKTFCNLLKSFYGQTVAKYTYGVLIEGMLQESMRAAHHRYLADPALVLPRTNQIVQRGQLVDYVYARRAGNLRTLPCRNHMEFPYMENYNYHVLVAHAFSGGTDEQGNLKFVDDNEPEMLRHGLRFDFPSPGEQLERRGIENTAHNRRQCLSVAQRLTGIKLYDTVTAPSYTGFADEGAVSSFVIESCNDILGSDFFWKNYKTSFAGDKPVEMITS